MELIEDALQDLGRIRDKATHERRRAVLLHYLKDESPRMRYCAITGLINLKDVTTKPDIAQALTVETDKMLAGFLSKFLERLEENDNGN